MILEQENHRQCDSSFFTTQGQRVGQAKGHPQMWHNIPKTPNHTLPHSCHRQIPSKVAASPSWPILSAKEPRKVNEGSGDLLRAFGLCHCLVKLCQLCSADGFHSTGILCWQDLQLRLQPPTELWTVILHNLLIKNMR